MVDVVTVRLDAPSQARFEALRQRYFPLHRNVIPAHLTMFHALPRAGWVSEAMELATAETAAFPMAVRGLKLLGRGVAYALFARELMALQAELAGVFGEVLPAQDRQRFQPHVVVQNKGAPEAARALLRELEAGFVPWTVRAEGLDLWHYMGGPWEHARTFAFRG